MPSEVCTTVFQYAELDEKAKENAREWYRRASSDDEFWKECVIEDVTDTAASFGIRIDQVYFTGFWSQGDGACFSGHYEYQKGWQKKFHEIYTPGDTNYDKLLNIAKGLQDIQRKYFYKMSCDIKHSGHYYHEHCIDVTDYLDGEDVWYLDTNVNDFKQVTEYLKDYMRYIYKQLQTEYEYQNSDEQVVEAIEANEYTFTKSGKRFG